MKIAARKWMPTLSPRNRNKSYDLHGNERTQADHREKNQAYSGRTLGMETLEVRQLLASDVVNGLLAVQNLENPYDVDYRDAATPMDAALIANHLNGVSAMNVSLDVDGDGSVTDSDFIAEVGYLNSLAHQGGTENRWQGDSGGLGSAAANGRPNSVPYEYYVFGNASDKLSGVTLPEASNGLALVGGGTDVDEVFRWMGQRASGGDFLVLRATGTKAYNPYISKLAPSLDSIATLIVPDSIGANDPFVLETVRNAEAIFFAGGDQADYVNFWSGTGLESAIYDALSRNIPIGGTSAGLAILGEFDFSALIASVSSPEAISNPYNQAITLDSRFVSEADFEDAEVGSSPLAYLNDTITDSHFQQRDRLGRLITFMARLDADGAVAASSEFGIDINEQTALLVDNNGIGRVVGNPYAKKIAEYDQQRSVYFLDTNTDAPDHLSAPLNFANIQVSRASYNPITGLGDTFDLNHWQGTGIDSYQVSVLNGQLVSTQSSGLTY